MVDTSYLPHLDHQTLGEDKSHQEDILSGRVAVFFRPGQRDCLADKRCIHRDAVTGRSYVGIIEERGSHGERQPAKFSHRLPCFLKEVRIMRFADLQPADFVGAYASIVSPEGLMGYFRQKYNLEQVPEIVTRYLVEYIK